MCIMGHVPCMFGPVAGQYCSRQVLHIVSSSYIFMCILGHALCIFGPVAGLYCSRQVLHIVSSSYTYMFYFCTGCRAPLLSPGFFHSFESVHSMLWKHYQGTLSLSREHNCFNNAFGQNHQGLMLDFKHEAVHVFPN